MPLAYVAPPPELAVELSEVRADAAALAEVFSQLNAPLPEAFPRQAVVDVAQALQELPSGTAKGCLRPLNEAQAQLALVRSQHILHDIPHQASEDRPALYRGELVDQRLRSLMSAVSTALQTANRLAAEEPEPEEPEFGAPAPGDPSTVKLIDQSSKAQTELRTERDDVNAVSRPNSNNADTLKRRLTDALILNWLGRGELRMPRIVAGRLRRIGTSLQEYPALLKQSAGMISAGADIADYGYEKWHKLKERIFHAGTDTIREVADDLKSYARRLERRRGNLAQSTAGKRPDDFDLEVAITRIHRGMAPPKEWRPFIEYLPLGVRKLRTLTPLVGLTNLRRLERVSVKVRDIRPVATLSSLESLDLSYTKILDIAPLAGLTNLRELHLDSTRISNLTPLKDILNLETLSVDNTPVSNITPLKGLAHLYQLSLRGTDVTDLTPLRAITTLRSLALDGTRVLDLSPLEKLSSIESLSLTRITPSEFETLRHLRTLKSLHLDRSSIIDLTPIGKLSALQNLYLYGTKVTDLGPLAGLAQLQMLFMHNTPVVDLSPLKTLTSLKFINVDNTRVEKLDSLAELRNLETLSLDNTPVKDLTPIAKLPSLKTLWVQGVKAEIPSELRQRRVTIFSN